MDTNRVEALIKWSRTHDGKVLRAMDWNKYFAEPLMEAFGDDVSGILAYLGKMEVEDLKEISGCFEDIYRKFTTDDVYNALGELEDKIA